MVESPEIVHLIFEYLVSIIEIIVGIVVAGTVIITLSNLFLSLISKVRKNKVRVRGTVAKMLRGLLFALDLLIAADILVTILDPALDEILLLVLIVVIRISLSWSLSKEIEISVKEEASTSEKEP